MSRTYRLSALVLTAVLWAAVLPLAAQAAGGFPPSDEQRVLVRFKAGVLGAERQDVHRRAAAAVSRVLPSGVHVIRTSRPDVYRSDPRVEFAEPDRILSIASTPDDPYFPGNGGPFPELWGLHNTGRYGTEGADIAAREGWELAGLGSGTPWPRAGYTVGVIDTGVDVSHPDLAGRVIAPCRSATTGNGTLVDGCADLSGHGTHVAGTVAAIANNAEGVVGVAPNARLHVCKALDTEGNGWASDISACVEEMVDKRTTYDIRVINLSIGGEASPSIELSVDRAWAAGILVVAAAGNDGDSTLYYPAAYPSVVSVAATDWNDERATFSNANAAVEMSAPGAYIASTIPGGVYASMSGTSTATPHVAGVAAMLSWRRGITGTALRDALRKSVDDLGPEGRDAVFGFGRVNLCKAMGGCDSTLGPLPSSAPKPKATTTQLKADGYWILGEDGGVFAFGGARFYGSVPGVAPGSATRKVDMASTASGRGYWILGDDGGMFAFGDAKFFGSMGGKPLAQPVVGMAPTPTGKGYWLVARDGGMFAFGDAKFFGSMGGKPLAQPVVGMAATPKGRGYWLVASDGGLFAFGDAKFYGSTGGKKLAEPVTGMAATPVAEGYWLVARDGGVFAFGDARFFGSVPGAAPGSHTRKRALVPHAS